MKYTIEDLDMGMYRNIAQGQVRTPVFASGYPYPQAVHDGRWHLSLILGVNIT